MSSKVKCPMCAGKKVFYIRTFFPTPKGGITPHIVDEPCPICEGQGFLVVKTQIVKS